MLPMIGYGVSYQRRAFRSKIDPDGLRRTALDAALKLAARIVYSKSEGRWLVVNKIGFVPFDKDEPVELMVIVPAGSDQYDQFLAAVRQFEDCMTGFPIGDPIDPALRSIEEEAAKCAICDKRPEWFYSTYRTGRLHFCDQHAKEDPDFRARYFAWTPLAPATH